MWICTQAFHTPKRGNVESEYEDAFLPERVFRRDLSEFHCAVADGASESAFSGEWARLLARGYCRRGVSLRRLQRCWVRLVTRRKVPWYLEAKIRRGAHAALVGLSIRDGQTAESFGGSWEVSAVGDSCFFHVRADELLAVAPISRSDGFNNRPHLISTDASSCYGLDKSRVTMVSGEWRPKDAFYLTTDALAQWALAEHEAGRHPWPLFRSLSQTTDNGLDDPEFRSFEELVAELRENGGLHNDDTTLLRIEVA